MADEPPAQQGWRLTPHGSLGSGGLVVLADASLQAFAACGVPLPPGNRASRALELIEKSHDGRLKVTKDDPDTRALIAGAIRDAWEFYLIARALPRERDADLDGKLKVMLRGSKRSNKPRDFQFEQVVGVLFAMAGIPARPAEPDLRFLLKDQEWGVAIKRVRSAGQLAPRTTQARRQLEEQSLRGFIAVNVDAFLADVPANRDPTEVGQAFDKAVARLHHLLPELATQRSVLGIMIIGAVAGWEFDGEKPRVFHPLIIQGRYLGDDAQDGAVADELFNGLERGIVRT
jgi:hypothetical protein